MICVCLVTSVQCASRLVSMSRLVQLLCWVQVSSWGCISYIPPASTSNAQDNKPVELRNSSTRLVGVCCAGTIWLRKTSSYRVALTSGFQGRVCLHCWHRFTQMLTKHLLPHWHYRRCRRTLSPPVCLPSFSFCTLGSWTWAACSCSIIVSIESFRLHIKFCVHAQNTPSKVLGDLVRHSVQGKQTKLTATPSKDFTNNVLLQELSQCTS